MSAITDDMFGVFVIVLFVFLAVAGIFIVSVMERQYNDEVDVIEHTVRNAIDDNATKYQVIQLITFECRTLSYGEQSCISELDDKFISSPYHPHKGWN